MAAATTADGIAGMPASSKRLDAFVLLAAGVAASLGLIVLIAWYSHVAGPIRVRPGFPAMMPNTALSLLACGTGLLLLARRRPRGAALCASVTMLVGVLTLLEYAAGTSLGIDQILKSYDLADPMSFPGRMAPHTAVCIAFLGTGAVLLATRPSSAGAVAAATTLATLAGATGLCALVGYSTGMKVSFGVGLLQLMGVHTAFGFLVLGSGLVAHVCATEVAAARGIPRWMPLIAGAAVLTVTLGLWEALHVRDRANVEDAVARGADQLAGALALRVERHLQTKTRMAARLGQDRDTARSEFETDAAAYLAQNADLRAIARVDPSLHVRWRMPQSGTEELTGPGTDRRVLDRAREARMACIGPPVGLTTGGRRLSLAVPVVVAGSFDGWILAEYDFGVLLDTIRDENPVLAAYALDASLCDGGAACPGCVGVRERGTLRADVALPGSTCHTWVRPGADFLGRQRSGVPDAALVCGILTALLLALSMHFGQTARRRERDAQALNRVLEREVVERRRAEEQMRHGEQRLERIVETIADGIFILDLDGRIVSANAAAEKMFGLSRSVLTERVYDDAAWKISTLDGQPFPSEDLPFARALRVGEPVHGVELVVERADGSRMVLSVNAVPIRDSSGTASGVVASCGDITRRKEVERMKDEFVSTVSHELRTPLTSLRGFAELMLSREFPPEKQREFLTIIRREAVRLSGLINDFLDLQRIESGRQAFEFGSVDLRTLVGEAAAVFRVQGTEREIQDAVPADLPRVWADADRVRQVLSNLLSNAVKYSPDGGVVRVGARVTDGQVEVSVADEGIGIAPEDLPMLFEKFFRADNCETRAVGGTGLGLALVKEIVEAHGGRVRVETELGHGSTFFVSLPMAESPDPSALARSDGLHDVLLAEDDHAFARLLAERFAVDGITIETVEDGERALASLRAGAVRLAMLDVHLAGAMDGWDVLTTMKSDPALRHIPALIISASDSINARGLAVAGADYLVKPVSPAWLVQSVRRQLGVLEGKRVLVVDDDADFRLQVRESLATERGLVVEEAIDGAEAVARMAERMPDLLILDLLMPDVDGFEVLRLLRADRRAVNLPVLVVTGKDLTPEDKATLKTRMATLVRKREVSVDHMVEVVRRVLEATLLPV